MNEPTTASKGAQLRFWLISALITSAVLRFAALGQKPLWCYELATLQRLSLPFWPHVQAMRGNHPLFELLLRFWMPADGSDAWMRIPSAAFGVACVWLTWLLTRRMGIREGLTATWLMALSPLHLMYSRMGRAYSLACLLALASTLALLWAMKRRHFWSFAAYAATVALMVYANLFAAALWLAQVLFLLWHYRRRWKLLGSWVLANLGAVALLAPWLWYSLPGAVTWGIETQYTARQFGVFAKAAYLSLTMCLGETIHPLNFAMVIPAFLAFGAAIIIGLIHVLRRRLTTQILLLVQVLVVGAAALCFGAIAAKHLTIILPAWLGIAAIGVWRIKNLGVRGAAICLLLATMAISIFNYFDNRQFADADMVTPWRQICAAIEVKEKPGDAVLVGYSPDQSIFDMFKRYYRGHSQVYYLNFADWKEQIISRTGSANTIFLLLHDTDPWKDMETWLAASGEIRCETFQDREHTLASLREGGPLSGVLYKSPLYRLYTFRKPPA